MGKFKTSWTILRHSGKLLFENKKLLLFPVANFFFLLCIISFFLVPIAISVPPSEMGEYLQALVEREDQLPYFLIVALYFISMFLATFFNVAYYNEILNAFNGKRVSLTRGFKYACTKLKAILVWSLLAGLVGYIIRTIEENVGFLGKIITALLGFAWSIASVFAIPVIIREEQQSNPLSYLKQSFQLITKTWGEGLIGVASLSFATMPIIFVWIVLGFIFTVYLESSLVFFFFVVMLFAFIFMVSMLRQIFLCGLYIYASEGVAPGEFENETFERAWKVKKNKR